MDIKKELGKVESDISKVTKNFVDKRGRAQIANLLDKVKTRQKLPNFVSEIPFEFVENGETITDTNEITLIQFLEGINTEVPKKDKPKLKELERQRTALTVLLERENKE